MTADIAQQISSWVGQLVIAGGGGAVVAYGIFKFLGKSWIENQLAKDLERAKSEISIHATRRMKLHDKEYVVFPELWSRLNKANGSLDRAIISLRGIPNFRSMKDADVNDWLNRSYLSEEEKLYFNEQEDKGRAYGNILGKRDLNQVDQDLAKFKRYLQNNRIFLSPEIKEKFDQIYSQISESCTAKEMDLKGCSGDGTSYLKEAWEKFDKQVKPLKVEIESLVQAKLFPESRIEKQ
jgi:hypothetical protein